MMMRKCKSNIPCLSLVIFIFSIFPDCCLMAEGNTNISAEEEFNLGQQYEFGKGVTKDDNQATIHYLSAAKLGQELAQGKMGMFYAVKRDYKQAAYWFGLCAKQGNSLAQYYLGRMYLAGEGVNKDDIEASNLFRSAAEKGNADAQYYLAECYQKGIGVKRNETEAKKYYQLAASQGHKKAADTMKIYSNIEKHIKVIDHEIERLNKEVRDGENAVEVSKLWINAVENHHYSKGYSIMDWYNKKPLEDWQQRDMEEILTKYKNNTGNDLYQKPDGCPPRICDVGE